jgi:VWFA-related protein
MKTLIAPLVLLTATTLFAQVSESIDVRVVNVDVTVMSKGVPVNGLTRDDFEILEDGRLQTITNFYTSEETRTIAKPPGAAAASAPQPDPRFRRRVLVLVDNNHTTRDTRERALRQLETMINDRFHGEYEWSIGVVGRGVTLVLPLSSDKEAIHEALEIIRREGTRGEGDKSFAGATSREGAMLPRTITEGTGSPKFDSNVTNRVALAMAGDDTERAIAARFFVPAILDAVRGFASTSGRKIVFLLTGDPGLNDPQRVIQSGNGFLVRESRDPEREIRELRDSIIHEANASDVSLFIWNVRGLEAGGDVGAGASYSSTGTDNSASYWLANLTGGRVIVGNRPEESVQEFDTASSSFYSLGYKPTHPDDGKYHAISVRVKRKGDYALAYRSGYSATSTAAQFARAMLSPTAAAMDASTLPVTLAFGTPKSESNTVSVPIEVKVPFSSLQFLPGKNGVAANLVVYVSVFNDIGKNIVARSMALTPAFKSGVPDPKGMLVYRNELKIRKGESDRVVVAIRDTLTEGIGIATEVVKF